MPSAAGQIALPILNMQKLTNRIMRDIQRLTPDLSGLMPGLNLMILISSALRRAQHLPQIALV
ncbi:hypothetical protein [Thalassospira alkalitolerans]|uniref:hypothetical protein n=1 Tax=Thalassospira alkalitolerans TaxID=1293890 RepID=UPI003AA9E14F